MKVVLARLFLSISFHDHPVKLLSGFLLVSYTAVSLDELLGDWCVCVCACTRVCVHTCVCVCACTRTFENTLV